MRLLDKTFLTEDEQYNAASCLGEQVAEALETLDLDTYNKQYVVRVTVDVVDES